MQAYFLGRYQSIKSLKLYQNITFDQVNFSLSKEGKCLGKIYMGDGAFRSESVHVMIM